MSLEDDALLSAAVAGLAFTDEADANPRRALTLFDEAARLALRASDDDGYAAV